MVTSDSGNRGHYSGATESNLLVNDAGYDEPQAYEGYEEEEYFSEGQIAASQADKVCKGSPQKKKSAKFMTSC